MADLALRLPLPVSLGTFMFRFIMGGLALLRPRRTRTGNIAAALSNQQRSDLGIENPPLDPVSKFQGFELDLWVAKQSSDALQHELLRGIER